MDASLMLNESISKSHDEQKVKDADKVEETSGFIGKFMEKTEMS